MTQFGRDILPVLRKIKNEEFSYGDISFKIGKIYLNWEKDRVLAYTIDYKINKDVKYFSMGEDIITITFLLRKLFQCGFCFKKDNFSLSNIDGVSSILSQLKVKDTFLDDESEKILLSIVYYLYFGSDIDIDFDDSEYSGFLTINYKCSLEAFNLLYKYYNSENEKISYSELASLQNTVKNSGMFEREVYTKIIEKDEVMRYGGEIVKLYKEANSPKLIYLANNIKDIKKYTFSEIISIIYNTSMEIVGYRCIDYSSRAVSLQEENFKCPYEIFEYIQGRFGDFLRMVELSALTKNINFYTGGDIPIFDIVNRQRNKLYLYFKTIDNYLDFIGSFVLKGERWYYDQVGAQCIASYSNYIIKSNEKLSKIRNSKKSVDDLLNEVCNEIELKYLTAGLAWEVVSYIAKGTLSNNFSSEYSKFISNCSSITINNKEYPFYNGYYDKNNIFKNEFMTKYNAIDKNGEIEIKNGKNVFISRKKIMSYSGKNWIGDLCKIQRENLDTIKNHFPELEKYCVKINEIVYSSDKRDEDDNSVYRFEGYVSDKITGKKLTDDYLSKIDNKSLAYLNFSIFRTFKNEFIPLDYIYYDEKNQSVQIDLLDTKIEILNKNTNRPLLRDLVEYFGYSNVILDRIDPDLFSIKNYNQYSKYDSKLDNYCKMHNLYFRSEDMNCPICSKFHLSINNINECKKDDIIIDNDAVYSKANIRENDYFIKVFYNKEKAVVENIEKLIEDKDISDIQSLFMPIKLLNDNTGFIGYTFVYHDAQKKFLKLTDNESIGNLMRVKGCVMLIKKVIKILNSGYVFWKNPFGTVLFVEGYQDAIITNTECIKKGRAQQDVMDTAKYTIEYIKGLINSDLSISLNIKDVGYSIDGLRKLITQLEEYITLLKKYCSKHGYYESKYFCCPKCIEPSKQILAKENVEYLENIDNNFWDHELNEGGEATIYRYAPGKVIKVFKEDEIDLEFKTQSLSAIIRKNDSLKEIENKVKSDGKYKFRYITIDKLIINRKENKLHSYIMEEINAINFSILKNRKSVEEELSFSRKDIIELLINAGKGIEYLHSLNLFIGDLNSRNIMFDKDKTVYFIDFDGMSVDGYCSNVFTDRYIDPISKNNATITMKDDWYSFAVQAFYYLTYFHPFNGMEKGTDNDILARMEQRKSVIDNPNIVLPKVALDWSWMPKEIIEKFKNIFEGDCRESIVPLLEKYYNIAYGNKYNNTEINKPNVSCDTVDTSNNEDKKESKRNKELDILDITTSRYGNPIRIIDKYSYITRSKECLNDVILKNIYYPELEIRIANDEVFDIKEAIINDNFSFVIYKNHVNIFETNNCVNNTTVNFFDDNVDVIINGNTMYSHINDRFEIEKICFSDNCNYTSNKIKLGKDMKIKAFAVENNSKFVIVKEDVRNVQYVYCNDEQFYTFKDSGSFYKILYDKNTKKWLVIRNDGKGIIIKNNANYDELKIDNIENCNINNFKWDYNLIYIPKKDKLLIYNTLNHTQKEIELKNIIDKNSKIELDEKGFEIINQNSVNKCLFN